METVLNFVGRGKIFVFRVSCTQIRTALRKTYAMQRTKSSPVPVKKVYRVRTCIGPHSLNLRNRWTWLVTFTLRPVYSQKNKPRYRLNEVFVCASEQVWTFCRSEKSPGDVENRNTTLRFSHHVSSSVQRPINDRSRTCVIPCLSMVKCCKLWKERLVTKRTS